MSIDHYAAAGIDLRMGAGVAGIEGSDRADPPPGRAARRPR
jgi:hypothetical protein